MGMIRRGSLPSAAVTCAGFSSFTRSAPVVGSGEGRLIASSRRLNLRSGRFGRGAMLAAGAIPLLPIALWVRTPTLPRTQGGGSGNGAESLNAAEGAIRALERALDETRSRLATAASSALDAPADPAVAFDYLARRSTVRAGEAIVLYSDNQPIAWTGAMRTDPESIRAP